MPGQTGLISKLIGVFTVRTPIFLCHGFSLLHIVSWVVEKNWFFRLYMCMYYYSNMVKNMTLSSSEYNRFSGDEKLIEMPSPF